MRRAGFRRRGATRAIVVVGLGAFVLSVYVVVVIGGGALIGGTASPSPILSVIATTVVALAFGRVQAGLERAAVGRATSPYDVLARFVDSAGDEDDTEDLSARMARLLAQGTGAHWAQVWLQVSGRMILAGRWPIDLHVDGTPPMAGMADATPVAVEGLRTSVVRYGTEELGALRLQERPGVPLTVIEDRLFTDLASQAGLVLRLLGLQVELEGRHRELQARTVELERSRARVIEAQDAERSRLERDIHDSAQQHLVALAMNLRLAQVVAARSADRARGVLAEQADAALVAIDTLSRLTHGIYPRTLSEQGLVEALRSGVGAGPIPVTVEAEGPARPPQLLEAAFYFCGMEAVQNAAKHSGATRVTVRLRSLAGAWRLDVIDDGCGFDQGPALDREAGAGLMNMRDRLDAVGGSVTVTSAVGHGTTVSAVGHVSGQGS
jgi:signal transduction histidine kinase